MRKYVSPIGGTMCGFLDFKGRVAVVTGGARGIGLAIARALADHGAEVHVFDVSPGEGGDAVPYRFHKVDISDSGSVAGAVAQMPAPASLLVNNAGITRDSSMIKMSDDDCEAAGFSFHPVQDVANDRPARLLLFRAGAEDPVAIEPLDGPVFPLER